jgi:hypothetical protein
LAPLAADSISADYPWQASDSTEDIGILDGLFTPDYGMRSGLGNPFA